MIFVATNEICLAIRKCACREKEKKKAKKVSMFFCSHLDEGDTNYVSRRFFFLLVLFQLSWKPNLATRTAWRQIAIIVWSLLSKSIFYLFVYETEEKKRQQTARHSLFARSFRCFFRSRSNSLESEKDENQTNANRKARGKRRID